MSFEFLDLILLLAAAQGFFLTVLIFHKHRQLFANRFLGSLILIYSIILLHLFWGELNVRVTHPLVVEMIIGIGFLMGPLHFLYATFLVHRNRRFSKKHWLHFLPFLCYECICLVAFTSGNNFPFIIESKLVWPAPLGVLLYNWLVIFQILIYMVLTVVLLNRYAAGIRNVFSSIEKVKLDWLTKITYLPFCFAGVFIIENILLLFKINFSNFFTLTSTLLAVYVYVLGYLGLLKSQVLASDAFTDSFFQSSESKSVISVLSQQQKTEKYEKSGLTHERAKQYLQNLLDLVKQEKPYKESSLTLNQLAERLSISPHNLSEVINTQLEQNFFDFINYYRVKEVQEKLADPNHSHIKILAIAFDAGFNSKTSFNTIFKKFTHQTPSEYRAAMLSQPTA